MMKFKFRFAAGLRFLLALLIFYSALATLPAQAAQFGNSPAGAEIAQDGPAEASSAICYYGGEGFMVAPPPGWGNLPYTAEIYGLCVMYAPAGYSFDNAPALIYPKVIALPGGENPVQVQVDRQLAQFNLRADSIRAEVLPGFMLSSRSGLEFEMRYFDRAPDPNNYELVAYYAGERALFQMVLTARNARTRNEAEADFRKVLYGIFPVQVRDTSGKLPE